MEITEKIKSLLHEKPTAVVTILGVLGLVLILISSLIPEKTEKEQVVSESVKQDYCIETEKRLEEFLSDIQGVGEAKVYISVGREEKYVYASDGKRSSTENKSEEEEKIVTVGSDKSALVETVELPEITGAVIVCEGGGSAEVQERVYKAVSAALGISTMKIYVTQLK